MVQQKHLEDLAGLLNASLRLVVELFTGTPAVEMEVPNDKSHTESAFITPLAVSKARPPTVPAAS